MKKAYLLSLPVLALVAVAGLAAAYPLTDLEDLSQEEKDLRVTMLGLKQEMIQYQIAYLNGEITQEQFQERLEAHKDEMQPVREQLRDMYSNGEAGTYGCGMGKGHKGFGRGLMGGV
jgi:ribonuclease PH